MQQKARQTDKEISKAFQDLDKLMEMAKPMVALANNISKKIRVLPTIFIAIWLENINNNFY